MQFYIRNEHQDKPLEDVGSPLLLYVCMLGENMKEHPRSIHSHHESVEILLVTQGQGACYVDGKRYTVAKDDLVVYNSEVVHDEKADDGFQLPNLCCSATGIQVEGLPKNHLLPPTMEPVIHLGERAKVFRHLLQALFDESYLETERSADICQSMFQALLKMTLNEIDRCKDERNCAATEAGLLGNQIKAYVNVHYLEPLSVETVARQFDISASYLSHVFKKTTGHSLVQYIMRRRLGEAQTLLISSNRTVKEIAASVGYDNTSYFNVLFTRSVGMPPLRYRKVYRGQGT